MLKNSTCSTAVQKQSSVWALNNVLHVQVFMKVRVRNWSWARKVTIFYVNLVKVLGTKQKFKYVHGSRKQTYFLRPYLKLTSWSLSVESDVTRFSRLCRSSVVSTGNLISSGSERAGTCELIIVWTTLVKWSTFDWMSVSVFTNHWSRAVKKIHTDYAHFSNSSNQWRIYRGGKSLQKKLRATQSATPNKICSKKCSLPSSYHHICLHHECKRCQKITKCIKRIIKITGIGISGWLCHRSM